MSERYGLHNFAGIVDCEIVVMPLVSGETTVIIGQDVGKEEESALLLTLSQAQIKALKQAMDDAEPVRGPIAACL